MALFSDILIGGVKLYIKGVYKVSKFTVKTTVKAIKGAHNHIKNNERKINFKQYSTNELKDLLILSDSPTEQKLIKSILKERITG
jgi:hypothetical protein